ncbi:MULTISPECIES: fumarylacetoacetate hydrolase family protein [Labilibaculum]|uniref:2-hydroxyhepta-2,4-diene-1,7-dioate isomerase n=1 Tax=Labilibaculum euxinus TaxID=2686357 RepID=A0A7M4D3F3_9BACT|nr:MULTISPECIES: fumarylacetoacetate hydrolase family protein [Labilibaculum]MBN2595610.1 fumarylacetoacetate hydrolase family protein [Marinifilaceae bacterium]MUP37182.1 2-hydroxyhepta-2,4-diene-1,7-dioate isomerase [Labilibaculum euxinus]MVB06387.1 2-hydroxyhepta-2,4-diene-1,7-dioate isomerase [Labilibaculum euxinus]
MKILAIGRNYENHAKELNNPVPEEPVVFSMPDSALLKNNNDFYYPDFSKDIHHEVEVVVKICRVGKNIPLEFAHRYYDEIGLGIDFTARDIQAECKKKGLPWEKAKAFDGAAPISKFISKDKFRDVNQLNFHLDINGNRVQTGNTSNMIFSIDYLISYLSQYFTLKIGDLIYTGTPEGVGPVKIGDHLIAELEGEKMMDFSIR